MLKIAAILLVGVLSGCSSNHVTEETRNVVIAVCNEARQFEYTVHAVDLDSDGKYDSIRWVYTAIEDSDIVFISTYDNEIFDKRIDYSVGPIRSNVDIKASDLLSEPCT